MADHDQYYIDKAKICEENGQIPAELYTEYDVKKGLRDKNGKGVVTGITRISRLDGYKTVDGQRVPMEGVLAYRGYAIEDLVGKHTPGAVSKSPPISSCSESSPTAPTCPSTSRPCAPTWSSPTTS